MTNNEDLPKILICYVEEVAYDAKSSTMSNYYEKIKRGINSPALPLGAGLGSHCEGLSFLNVLDIKGK